MNNADHKYLADLFEGNPVGHKWVYEAIDREVEKRMKVKRVTEKDQLLSAALGFGFMVFTGALIYLVGRGGV